MHVEMSALAALTTEKDIHLEDLIYAIEVAYRGPLLHITDCP